MESYFKLKVADGEGAIPPREHYHPDYEVYYLTEGRCRYFIHDKTYAVAAGDVVVIPPGRIHKVMYETPQHSRVLFNCTAEFVPPSVVPFVQQLAYCQGHWRTVSKTSGGRVLSGYLFGRYHPLLCYAAVFADRKSFFSQQTPSCIQPHCGAGHYLHSQSLYEVHGPDRYRPALRGEP